MPEPSLDTADVLTIFAITFAVVELFLVAVLVLKPEKKEVVISRKSKSTEVI